MKKKKIAKKIIKQSGKLSIFLLKVMLLAGAITLDSFFSPSFHRITKINYKELWNEPIWDFDNKIAKPKPRSFSTALQRLRKQGLVNYEDKKWSLTSEGKKFMQSFFQIRSKHAQLKLPEKDEVIRIVIFDIPEKEREKRDWIRGELLYHEYEPLQKSVWIGYRPLLLKFIKNIDFLNLSSCVHIFSVNMKN